MKKLAVMAGVAAFAASLFADPISWFDAKISEYESGEWPDLVTVQPENGSWESGAENVTWDGGALQLQNADAPLVFAADNPKALASTVPTVTSEILFTAYDEDDKPEIPADAKGGIIVCEDAQGTLSYWGVAKVESANAWVKLDGTPDLTIPAMVSVTVTGSTVTYQIDYGTPQTKDILIAADSSVSKATFQGVGSVSVLAGSYVDALKTLTINVAALAAQNLQVSVSGATPAGEGTYTFTPGTDITLTFAPVAGAYMLGTNKTKTYAAQADDLAISTRPDGVSKAFTASDTDPLEIGTYDEFVAFKDLVNAGDTFEGKFIKQTATIDFAGHPWTGIGWETVENNVVTGYSYFKGTYDGNDYQLANVTFAKEEYNGIFKFFGGTLKDLVVNMVGFDSSSEVDSYGAAVVGNTRAGATFNHVITTGALDATHNVAGFAVQGHVGTYIGCTNGCAISSASRNRVAGFVSFAQTGNGNTSTFTDCANEADITGGATAGTYGVTAYIALLSNGHEATFNNCVNTGKISCSNPNGFVGVFVGQLGNSGNSGSCSLTLNNCPASTTQKPIGHIVHSTTGTETFNGYFAKTVDEVLMHCATPTTKGTYTVVMPNSEAIVLADVAAGDTLTLVNYDDYEGTVSCADSTLKVGEPVNGVWTVEAVPQGTTFTIAEAVDCEVSVTIGGTPATAPYVAQIGDTVVFTLAPTEAPVVPSFSGSIGNASLVNANFTAGGAYSYTVADGAASEISCSFKVIDASANENVQPIDVVPAGTDANKIADAAAKIETLATKGGSADVALTQKIAGWIKTKSISGNAIAAIGTDGALTAEDFEAAYLLGTDLDAEDIAEAKAAFKFPSITPGTAPTIEDKGYNGTINYLGSDDLKVWDAATDANKFFKAELVK